MAATEQPFLSWQENNTCKYFQSGFCLFSRHVLIVKKHYCGPSFAFLGVSFINIVSKFNHDSKMIKISFKIWFIQRVLMCFGVIGFIVYLTHSSRFAVSYDFISDDRILENLFYETKTNSCPALPISSTEMKNVEEVGEYDVPEFALVNGIKVGGSWEPDNCEAVHDIALVVPYRGRPKQLSVFLHHIHPFLKKQLLSYRVFIVEQTYKKEFNRGKLMNVGYKEAMKYHQFKCFVFHDVDLLPQVDGNIYGCTKIPRHMSASINVWRYKLLYGGAFGGVISMLQEQFLLVNGFSNLYYGWGGEDDDILKRVVLNQLGMCRFSPEISRYYMLHHKPETKNPERGIILKGTADRYQGDGLNTLTYSVLETKENPLYTHFLVDL